MRRLALCLAALALAACDTEDPTTVVVDDQLADAAVVKAWWETTYLPDTVAAGKEGPAARTVPDTDYAYVVIQRGAALIPLRSSAKLTAPRGGVLHIRVSESTFTGDCAAGRPLAQDDADFITQRIFPAEFADATYDAATCTASPRADAGADGG